MDTQPQASTPDLVVYPLQFIDFSVEIPARQPRTPLVAIEIQSPSQSLAEMVDKTDVYFAFGVKSCWIVQPRMKAIFVFSRHDQYQFFHYNDLLIDPNFNIELQLRNIFV